MDPLIAPLLIQLISVVFTALILGGIVLLVRGLYPRRQGDTPYCRKCHYNLTGTNLDADDARCPECGTQYTLNELFALLQESTGDLESGAASGSHPEARN